jgi:hypothetical protein
LYKKINFIIKGVGIMGKPALERTETYEKLEECAAEKSVTAKEVGMPQGNLYYQYLREIKVSVKTEGEDFCTAFMYA